MRLAVAVLVACALLPGVARAEDDDDIPGVPFGDGRVTSSIGDADIDDVYAITLESGRRVRLLLDGAPGSDLVLFLYPPDETSIHDASGVRSSPDEPGVYPQTIDVTPSSGGTWYAHVFLASGGGPYTLSLERFAADGAPPAVTVTAPPGPRAAPAPSRSAPPATSGSAPPAPPGAPAAPAGTGRVDAPGSSDRAGGDDPGGRATGPDDTGERSGGRPVAAARPVEGDPVPTWPGVAAALVVLALGIAAGVRRHLRAR